MTILSLTSNRRELIDALYSITGNKMRYQGPPTFSYTDGTFTINREGHLIVESIDSNVGVLKQLAAKKYIEDSWDEDRSIISIDIPISKHTGPSLVRLVRIIWTKEQLINKAVGSPAGFKISDGFMDKLSKEPPANVSEFLFLWEQDSSDENTKGLTFDDKKIHFVGVPYTQEPEWLRAYMDLATAISDEALAAKKVRPLRAEAENERYYFRVWLVRIGLNGDDYKSTRKALLSKLSGNSAFKTEVQALRHKDKYGRH